MDDIYRIILYVGSSQGLILTVFLMFSKRNVIANRILSLLTLCWSIILLIFALQFDGFFIKYPHFLRTFSQLLFIIFPLVYLYVKYIISKRDKFYSLDLLHFMPFVVIIALYSTFYFKSADEKIAILSGETGYYHWLTISGDIFLALQGIIYSALALALLRRYKRMVLNYMSDIDKINLIASQRGIYILLLAWIVGSIATILTLLNVEVSVDLFLVVYLLIVIVIYWISYMAIRSPEVFKLDKNELFMVPKAGVKMMADAELELLDQKLKRSFEEEKPFLQPDLSLQELADKLTVPRQQLSSLINTRYQKNFYEFVNTFRVEEVKKLMADSGSKGETIINIAYDSGFNSKASFYRIFKQFTGQTPSQYLEKISA